MSPIRCFSPVAKAGTVKNEWPREELEEFLDRYRAVTIPVSITVEGKQKVLSFDEAARILGKAKLISVEPCYCRSTLKNCDNPVDVCLAMDKEAEIAIAERGGKRTTMEGALSVLKRSNKAGLVHMAVELKNREIRLICSCCSCCCYTLSALTRFGYEGVVGNSDVIAVHDPSTCDDCEVCIGRCNFNAWGMVGEKCAPLPPEVHGMRGLR